MLIKSNFHDYYDGVMRHGQDRSLVYIRTKKEEEAKFPFPTLPYWFEQNITVDAKIVGFCGQLYPVLIFDGPPNRQTGEYGKKYICHDMKDVEEFISKLDKKAQSAFNGQNTKKKYARYLAFHPHPKKRVSKFIDDVRFLDVEGIFIKNYCPIFVVKTNKYGEKPTIIYNCSLRELEFFRVFPPYQAFQKISMFLGSLAVPQKPLPVIPDEVMVEVKGFHKKYSFRKDKST